MPLHAVLFPGMPMPLSIVEDRYLRMLDECVASDAPFGVALIATGPEVGGIAQPHQVGTLAKIVHASDAEDDPREERQVLVVGRDRFRIRRIVEDEGLLRANVDVLRASDDDLRVSSELCSELAEMLQRHVMTVLRLIGGPEGELRIPEDPERLSFMVAAHITSSLQDRQALLEIPGSAQRLMRERELLAKESEQYRLLLASLEQVRRTQGSGGGGPRRLSLN